MGMSNPSQSSFVDERLTWDISFFHNCNDEDEDGEILTALVRASYMNHMSKSLVKNYEQWLDSNKRNENLNCSKDGILKCAKILEHKALRACMIARYYQQEMVMTIKEIKKSTAEGNLYSPLIEHVFDSKIKNQYEKGTKTSISLTNDKIESPEQSEDLIQMQLQKETPTSDNILDNSNLIILNPTDKCDIDKGNNDLKYITNTVTKSPNLSEKKDNHKAPSPKKKYEGETIKEIKPDSPSESNDLTYSSDLDENTNRKTLDERIQEFAILFDIDKSNVNSEVVKNTNEPLAINSLNGQDDMISEDDTIFKPALDWKSEYAAQNCNLKCILSRLNPIKKAVVQQKFNVLFGITKPINSEISITEAALSRKRTANLVVGVLTPYYLGGKIATRNLFKSLAKKITDDILLVTNIADLEEVTDKVNAYFQSGRCINSEEDIMNA